jgi:hypothetical protein
VSFSYKVRPRGNRPIGPIVPDSHGPQFVACWLVVLCRSPNTVPSSVDPRQPDAYSLESRAVKRRNIRIVHVPSGTLIAEGPVGWAITPFEGNYYIRRKHLKTDAFKVNFLPGLCFYKFFYVWMDLVLNSGARVRNLGWLYFLPNPLFPFIWFRVAVPGRHPELAIEPADDESIGGDASE